MNDAKPPVVVAQAQASDLTQIKAALSQLRCQSLDVRDGAEVVALCAKHRADLAILDTCLPEMSGLDLAMRLRRETSTAFIFLSAQDDSATITAAVEQGAFAYLVKPQTIKAIAACIRAALARTAELRAYKQKESDLQAALSQRRETSVAVGIVMQRFQVSMTDAFEALRQAARERRCRLEDLASAIVRGNESPEVAGARLKRG